MRVAFVDGPLFEYRLPFLKALQERVVQLRVFAPSLGFDLPLAQLRASGLDVSPIRSFYVNRTVRHPVGGSNRYPLDFPWNVLPVLSRFQPDVVISGEMGLRTIQAAAFRRRSSAARLVMWARVTEHTETARGSARQVTRKALVRHADAIITNGSSGRRYLMGLGADPTRVHVVHQASALAERPSGRRPGIPRRLLFVGRLINSKGLHLLLPVLRLYPPGSWALTVAGDGPELERLRAFTSKNHLPVEFAGFVPRVKLPELFGDHDMFVFPTLTDEWGLVVGEALRAGLPVLGSIYSEAVCEIVEEGVTGWVMRPDSEDSIRAALDRAFAATDADLMRAREQAQDSVRRLTPEAMADQFVDVLYAVCTTRRTDRLAVR